MSKRSTGHDRSACASRPPVPTGPTQFVTARSCPGIAGCGVHFRLARASSVDDSAHSTCGHTAAGDAWIYTTPVVASANWFDARIFNSFGSTRDVFPNDLGQTDEPVSCVSIMCLVWRLPTRLTKTARETPSVPHVRVPAKR